MMDFEKSMLTKTFKQLETSLEKIWDRNVDTNNKDPKESEDYRKRGNLLFTKKVHNDKEHRYILTYYNKSIAHAPMGSEQLAYAYGNRAAFLLHDKKYEECIRDCDRALQLSTISEALKCKILCRKAECMNELGLHGCKDVINEAEKICDNISDNKSKVELMVDKVKSMSIKNVKPKIYQKSYKLTTPPVTDNVLDFVRIEYSEKYGNHLVANKDYEAGDVIITEKLYAHSIFNEDKLHSYCHHCLKFLWSGVPCNHCAWAMFCSEECYQEAWEQFHNYECASLSFLKKIEPAWSNFCLSMRILLLNFKKLGGVDKLKAYLESIDTSADAFKSFTKNSKFDGINSLYYLFSTVSMENHESIEFESQIVAKALIGLVKYTNLFENKKIQSFKEFLSNDDVNFLGSLLIKISIIRVLNGFASGDWKFDPRNLNQDVTEETERYTECLTFFPSFTNHSCNPNACRYITEDHKMIIIADYPIKKNSQIFLSYCETFDIKIREDRHKTLKQYNFKCDCQACTENWPLPIHSSANEQMGSVLKNPQVFELMKSSRFLFNAFYFGTDAFLNKKDMKKLSQAISKGYPNLQKSVMFRSLVDMLRQNLSQMYLVKSPVFSQCGTVN